MLPQGTRPTETTVWLTEWQVAEEGLDVHAGLGIAWRLIDAAAWHVSELFAGRRAVDLELDTYAEAIPQPVLYDVRGVVKAVEAVLVQLERTSGGRTVVPGSARAVPIASTAGLASSRVAGYIVTLESAAEVSLVDGN